MTIEQLRSNWDWSNTKADMRDRVTRAIFSQMEVLQACCGPLKPYTVFTWIDIDTDVPLSPNNISLRNGLADVPENEHVIGVPL